MHLAAVLDCVEDCLQLVLRVILTEQVIGIATPQRTGGALNINLRSRASARCLAASTIHKMPLTGIGAQSIVFTSRDVLWDDKIVCRNIVKRACHWDWKNSDLGMVFSVTINWSGVRVSDECIEPNSHEIRMFLVRRDARECHKRCVVRWRRRARRRARRRRTRRRRARSRRRRARQRTYARRCCWALTK